MVDNRLDTNVIDKRLSRNVLKRILDNSYDEISVSDASGIIIYMNEACERHYGLRPEQVIGKTVYSLTKSGYWAPVLAPVVLKEKRRVTMEQMTHIGRKMVVTATPVLDSKNNIEFIVWNSRDITEIESMKHDLMETKKMVEHYRQEVYDLRKRDTSFEGYIASSKAMKKCLELANKIAAVDSTVLITGETGTGKNVIAKYVHNRSLRRHEKMMKINCAAIPEQLLESELFGYCGGAFTGADRYGKQGLVELANGGTLFLDEIGEIPISLQAKLLELVQENSFIPVGGKCRTKVDIRIIAATNRNLEQLVEEEKFRQDLYYRLNVINIHLPPLRDRVDDIIPLLNYYLEVYDNKYKRNHWFTQQALDILVNHTWPGNIREIGNLVERLVVTISDTKIRPEHLSGIVKKELRAKTQFEWNPQLFIDDSHSLKEKETQLIMELYRKLGSSYKVADALKISQSKVSRTVRKQKAKKN